MNNITLTISLVATLVASQTQADEATYQAQILLTELGYDVGGIDGSYGGKTRRGLEEYFSNNGSSFDGRLDQGELDQLLASYLGSSTDLLSRGPTSAGNYTHAVKYGGGDNPPFWDTLNQFFSPQNDRNLVHISGMEPQPLNVIKGIDELIALGTANNGNVVVGWDDVSAIMQDFNWRYGPTDVFEDFVRYDLNNDGDQDWLLFLFGFSQVNLPDAPPYESCGRSTDCVSGDVRFPVMAIVNDQLVSADQFFTSGTAPLVKNGRMIRITDLNADGKDDLVIADGGWDNPPYGYKPSYRSHLMLTTESGKFEYREIGQVDKTHGIAVGDIDGDGDEDIILTYVSGGEVFKNDGIGNFEKTADLPVLGSMYNYAELYDFNFDGSLDLEVSSGCEVTPSIFANDGNGTFSTSKYHLPFKPGRNCGRAGGQKALEDEFNQIHHSIRFGDDIVFILSNSHFGWGYKTVRITANGGILRAEGEFLEIVPLDHFPYKLSSTSTDGNFTIFDFNFKPFKFEYNEVSGEVSLIDNSRCEKYSEEMRAQIASCSP